MIIIHKKLILTSLFFILNGSSAMTCNCCNNQLQQGFTQLKQEFSQQTTFDQHNQEIKYQIKKHRKNNNKNGIKNNRSAFLSEPKILCETKFLRETSELGMYSQFDIDKLSFKNPCEETMNGSWQLNKNCMTDKSINMENSIFEITNGVRFETQYNSTSCLNLNNSTFILNNGGKYVHQSNNFNVLDNETKVILYPDSRVIWNSPNYRLFDATGNTLFIAYPDSVVESGNFGNQNITHYIIDGNNKTSTIYLNRVKYDSPNANIQGILYDINVVLPTNNNNTCNIVSDESTQLSNCAIYPNLYFKNCTILNEDYTRTVDVKTITDWIIKGNYNNEKNNAKAILSKRDVISSDQISNNSNKFAVYDIELGYADKNIVSDERAKFSSLFNGDLKSEYNISHIVIGEEQYPCYFDLLLLPECFNLEDNNLNILNNLPNILNVGLIGNNNIKLVNCNINEGLNNYNEVKLLGNNTDYYGIIFVSSNTENITFGENSYARVDTLFDNAIQSNTLNNNETKKRYLIGETQSNKTSGREKLSSIAENLSKTGTVINEHGIKCNVIFDGSNKVLLEAQSISNLNVTKNAKHIKLIPYDKSNQYIFSIDGTINLEEYVSDKNNENGLFIIDEGVELKA